MATKTKKLAKGKQPPAPGRISRRAVRPRRKAILRIPDSGNNVYWQTLGLLEPLTEAALQTEKAIGVILTKDAVENAIRALVRLAARWEIDDGFKTAKPGLRKHNLKALEDVVAILQVAELSVPIDEVNRYRITRNDALRLSVYETVKANLAKYRTNPIENDCVSSLKVILGISHRIPVEQIQRQWDKLVAAAAKTRPDGKPCSKNWVRDAGGPAQAAKKLLGDLMPGDGAADSRIAALKRIVAIANSKGGKAQSIDQIFADLACEARGVPLSQTKIKAYVARVFGYDLRDV